MQPIRNRRPAPWGQVVAAVLLLAACPTAATAALWKDGFGNDWFWRNHGDQRREPGVSKTAFYYEILDALRGSHSAGSPDPAAAIGAGDVLFSSYLIDDTDFTVEPGEPTVSGVKRTVWRRYIADRDARIAINTYGSNAFGSPLDTILAVYKVKGPGDGKRITSNDDGKIVDGTTTASFVQFDAVKGAEYAIQVGDRDTGGDVLISTFEFPPAGGLTIQPVTAEGGYDYACLRAAGSSGACPPAAYLVTNATDKTLTVSASSDLGAGVTAPGPFKLAPGAAAVKSFVFAPTVGGGAAGAVSGVFTFSGVAGSKTVATIKAPARVATHDNAATAPAIEIKADAVLRSGSTAAPLYRAVQLRNTGATTARGCYLAPDANEPALGVVFVRYDPTKDKPIGDVDAPFDLAARATTNVMVAVRSIRDRLADLRFAKAFQVACASGPSFPATARLDLSNAFDFSNNVKPFAKIELASTTPAGGVLGVGSGGTVMDVKFRNTGRATEKLDVKIAEVSNQPSGGPKRYAVSLCKDSLSDAACLASSGASLSVKAKKGKTFGIKVAVRAPAQDPGFDPAQIGLILTLSQPYSKDFPVAVPVGGLSRALKRL